MLEAFHTLQLTRAHIKLVEKGISSTHLSGGVIFGSIGVSDQTVMTCLACLTHHQAQSCGKETGGAPPTSIESSARILTGHRLSQVQGISFGQGCSPMRL